MGEPKDYAQMWTDGGGDPTFDEIDGFLLAHFNARALHNVVAVEVAHRGTMYRIFRMGFFFMLQTGWGSNYGEWIRTENDSIAWSYLAEKMPIMAQRDGDREGWVLAFKEAGVEVFNWKVDDDG